MLPLIAERKDNPGEDLISKIVHAEIDGERLSDIEIKSFVSFLLVAGSETTDLQMANMWLRLLEHPEQLAAVRQDRSLIPAAFAETLRHTPAVLMIMRQASEDTDFHNKTVRAGETVTLLLAAANQLLDSMDDIAFADGITPKQEGNFVRAPRSFPVTFRPT